MIKANSRGIIKHSKSLTLMRRFKSLDLKINSRILLILKSIGIKNQHCSLKTRTFVGVANLASIKESAQINQATMSN